MLDTVAEMWFNDKKGGSCEYGLRFKCKLAVARLCVFHRIAVFLTYSVFRATKKSETSR
jgi:hypothetical protein